MAALIFLGFFVVQDVFRLTTVLWHVLKAQKLWSQICITDSVNQVKEQVLSSCSTKYKKMRFEIEWKILYLFIYSRPHFYSFLKAVS